MAKKSFFHGALILTIAGVFGKILSAGYRVPFNRMVGAEGAGIYSMSYSIYSIIFALSTAGIPLAVSKMVAVSEERQQHGESVRIVRVAAMILALIGMAAAAGFFFAAPWIADYYFNEPRVAPSLRALAPAMLFSCLMAVFRGFFQGQQNMIPTAISQILEQFFRVGTILLSLFLLIGEPLAWVVAGASFGSMVGGVCGFVFLLVVFFRYLKKHPELSWSAKGEIDDKVMVKQLFYYAIPISIGALMLPMMQFIDSSFVARVLQAAGLRHDDAISQLGYISNYAMPIINLPFIITTAISASLIPAVANAQELGDRGLILSNVRSAMMLTVIITLPAAAGLSSLATPISVLLYDDLKAGPVLASLAFTIFVVGVYQASSGALQGLGRVLIPMSSLLMGLVGKVGLTVFLTYHMGAQGAAWATVLAFGLAALYNLYWLGRSLGWQWFDLRQTLLKPLMACLAMIAVVFAVRYGIGVVDLGYSWMAVAGIPLGGVVYAAVLFMIGGIEPEALRKLPKVGPKLAQRLER